MDFLVGQKINLPGHFNDPVVLEAVREIVGGFEFQVILPDGTLDEAILSPAEAAPLAEQVSETPQPLFVDAEKLALLVGISSHPPGICS